MASTHELLQEFLARQAGSFYCEACLAAVLGLHSGRVAMVMIGLRQTPNFEVRDDLCSLCGSRRWVIRRRQEQQAS